MKLPLKNAYGHEGLCRKQETKIFLRTFLTLLRNKLMASYRILIGILAGSPNCVFKYCFNNYIWHILTTLASPLVMSSYKATHAWNPGYKQKIISSYIYVRALLDFQTGRKISSMVCSISDRFIFKLIYSCFYSYSKGLCVYNREVEVREHWFESWLANLLAVKFKVIFLSALSTRFLIQKI